MGEEMRKPTRTKFVVARIFARGPLPASRVSSTPHSLVVVRVPPNVYQAVEGFPRLSFDLRERKYDKAKSCEGSY